MNTTLKSKLNAPRSAGFTSTPNRKGVAWMKAMVYAEPGQIRLQDCPKPVITAPGDATVRITHTTICGTDLHILKGDVPTATPGRILGHEGVGVIDSGGWILGNTIDGNALEAVMRLTGGAGVDTAIETVGIPTSFELCEQLVAAGGTIANIGVHGKPVGLHLETLWDRNIAITTRLVDTATIPMLFKTVTVNKIDPTLLITHHFTLAEGEKTYETFGNAAETRALKVIITI